MCAIEDSDKFSDGDVCHLLIHPMTRVSGENTGLADQGRIDKKFMRSGRGGRVVEGARLESVYTGNRIAGSNPAPSAICAYNYLKYKEFLFYLPFNVRFSARN